MRTNRGGIKITIGATQHQGIITAIGQHIAAQVVAAFQGQPVVAPSEVNRRGLVGPRVHRAR